MPGVEEILGEAGDARTIAASADHIYWTDGEGHIGRANLDGSNPEREWLQLSASCLAIGGAYLYVGYSFTPEISRVKLDGSGLIEEWVVLPQPEEGGITGIQALAADAGHLYYAWVNSATGVAYIGRLSIAGTEPEPEWIEVGAPVEEVQVVVAGITLTSTHIYWTVEQPTPHRIGRAAITGASVEPEWFLTGEGQPVGLTNDGLFLYWVNYGAEVIFRIPLSGGMPEPGPSELEGLAGITWRNGVLYWTLEGGRIYRLALEEGPPEEPSSFTLSERIFFLAQRGLPFPVVSAVLKVTPAEVERILSTVPRPEAEEAPDE